MLASEITRSIQLDDIIRAHGSESLLAFTKTLSTSPDCTIERFLNNSAIGDRSELAALVAIELRHRISNGEPSRIEDYLQRFPELKNDAEQVLDLIYAEYCERRQHETSAQPQEYFQRFPDFTKSLERLFQLDSLLQVDLLNDEVVKLPEVGDRFLEFHLKRELGRGGCGRVFLAEQETLSKRRVVLKITSRHTIEDRTLARLNHPNIVPILSVHHDDESGLHAVCMPYQHAVALSDIQKTWAEKSIPPSAHEYLTAAAIAVCSDTSSDTLDLKTSDFPLGKSFVFACAWIMSKIADALHHAHMRHICHRDLKPSNVLLTAAGNPLLVDFNLSFNEEESGTDFGAFFGGTLPYVPPEQILALHPIEQGRAQDVGPRADIYSLAATMFEILTGRPPFESPDSGTDVLTAIQSQLERRSAGIPSARAANPNVPGDLDALLAKCMDPAPERRYESAAQLAEDLTLFLADYPLRHVTGTQLRHRFQKLLRRNRQRFIVGATLATVGLVLGAHLMREREARDLAQTQVTQLQTTAEKEADLALARLPVDAYKYFRLGREFFIGRQYGHAMRCFTRSLNLQPDYAPAYLYRGRCLANLDRDAEALEDYSKAIQHEPNDIYALITRAACYATSTTHSSAPEALADLERARKLLLDKVDDSAKMIHLEMARTYSAVSRLLSNSDARANVLRQGESDLLKSFDLGLSVDYLNETQESDRFRRLDPLLEQPTIKKILAERHKKSE